MQVFLILLKWLQTLTKSVSDSTLPEMYLAYDNMCNVDRLKVARAPLPLPPPMDTAWLNIKKIIDTFHLPNHVNPECHRVYSPQTLKESWRPTLKLVNRRLSGLADFGIYYVL